MKLILHIGHSKCASTSLQVALHDAEDIYYPRHGLHHVEHIALPLKLKGLDNWTSQWISQEWVDKEFDALVGEVNSVSVDTVIISSERLADITLEQLKWISGLFPLHDIELLLLYRPVEDYVKSMWRHAVFRHDLSEDFELFQEKFKYFNPTDCIGRLNSFVSVHAINISDVGWSDVINDTLGIKVNLPRDNVSAPLECCFFLQQLHKAVGSEQFKLFFTPDRKAEFASIFNNDAEKLIDDFIVPIMCHKK